MIEKRNDLSKLLSAFYKGIFRVIYVLSMAGIPMLITILFSMYSPLPPKINAVIDAILWILTFTLFILAFIRSIIAISYFEENNSFSKSHYLSGKEIKFKLSFLPIIGFLFKEKET
jgi:hypothetical protein